MDQAAARAASHLGQIAYAGQMIREGEVDEVVIGMPWTARTAIQRFLALLSETPVRVSLATEPVAEDPPMQRLAAFRGVPVLRLSDRPFRGLPL